MPGPREQRYVAGQRVRWMLGWAPESGNQTLGTCIFTYDGQVHLGFKVDTGVIARPEELMTACVDDFTQIDGYAVANGWVGDDVELIIEFEAVRK